MMLKNYLLIALRNIKRHKGYSFINIAGLALGLTVFMLIFLWVQDELGYDQFHEKKDQLYRVIRQDMDNPNDFNIVTSFTLGPLLTDETPEIIKFTRVWRSWPSTFQYQDKTFHEKKFAVADSTFFEMFSFAFIKGTPQTALLDKSSVVITEETANRYFGNEDPLGKVLIRNNRTELIVTGVIENIPHNSHLQFDIMGRVELIPGRMFDSWEGMDQTYVLLNPQVSVRQVNRKIAGFFKKHDQEQHGKPCLQPLTDVHLYESGLPGRIKYLYIFSSIAILVLLIACINFMSLTTARSTRRAREVGVRKTAGASRHQLIQQFFSESMIFAFLALLSAFVLVQLLLPAFNNLSGKQLVINLGENLIFLPGISLTAFLTGIISGSYPALFLSGFKPANVLKGGFQSASKGAWFRRCLVIFQFSTSIFLIISTIIIQQQIDYIHHRNLGFNKNHIIHVPMNKNFRENYEALKNDLLQHSSILGVTAASHLPTQNHGYFPLNWEGNLSDEGIQVVSAEVDHDYLKVFQMEVIRGRDFSREYETDQSEAYIINEKALAAMKLKSPVNKKIYFSTRDSHYYREGRIIGVAKDFHFNPLHEKIEPLIMRIYPPWFLHLLVKVKPDNLPQTINNIESITKKYAPTPLEYTFLDQEFNMLYYSEHQMGKLFKYFAFLTIFIACLGLWGLAAFTAEQKTKEIGIRKVFGSSVTGIVVLLTKNFTKWVVAANVIAWPVAYYMMNNWLQDFAYKTVIGFFPFIITSFLALFIVLITISYQAIKAALANPVEALKYE